MHLLDVSFPYPAENLALDEALLIAAEERAAGEVLRFWELPAPTVVLGAGGSVAIDVNVPACETDRVPILRRASGGGTVVLGPGCLCFSLVLAYARAQGLDQIPVSNRYVLGKVLAALKPVTPKAVIQGTSDLVLSRPESLKFSGSGQQRKRQYFLHHGTLLYDFDLELISRYLLAPERQPDYRREREHRDFVANMDVNAGKIKMLLSHEWMAASDYSPLPWDLLQRLMAEKYSRDEWHRRR